MINYESYIAGPREDVLVLELTGRLDEHSADFLLQTLRGWVDRGVTKMVLDCRDLEHVSSFGLATLVRLHTRLRKAGGQVNLAGVSGLVAEVLRIVHFEKLFHLYPSVEQACEALTDATEDPSTA